MVDEAPPAEPPVRQRPRLNLKPRNESAAAAAEAERQGAAKASPFGAAKPRETILATRLGKDEQELLKEESLKEKLSIRLLPEQQSEKRSLEAIIEETQSRLDGEGDEEAKGRLEEEIKAQQDKLAGLLAGFEKLAVERARSGEVGMRPSERRRLQQQQEAAMGYDPAGGAYPQGIPGRGGGRGYDYSGGGRGPPRGAPGYPRGSPGAYGSPPQGYNNFGRGGPPGPYGSGSYEEQGYGGLEPHPSYGEAPPTYGSPYNNGGELGGPRGSAGERRASGGGPGQGFYDQPGLSGGPPGGAPGGYGGNFGAEFAPRGSGPPQERF